MTYAQINYQQKVGNSNLTIAEIGCFDTADCNLLEAVGIEVDPATLNQFYTDNGIYTYDFTDRANDDITWGSVSRYDADISVREIGGAGWPQDNLAIVEFSYISSHTGARITHFCKVADWQNQMIVDSYDGVTKKAGTGTYYGEPVAWATFAYNPPAPTPPPPAPAVAAPQPQANITYTKLDTPLNLRTKSDPTHWWRLDFPDYNHAVSEADLPPGTPFQAYGKAQRTDLDHPVYFMTQEDFGNADTTGIPTNNNGVNTVDLEAVPAATSEAVVTQPVIEAPTVPAEITADAGEKVAVTVVPVDPNKWKTITKFLSEQDFIATESMDIPDMEGVLPPQQLVGGQPIKLAGWVLKDGETYYLTLKSITAKTLFGIPEKAVRRNDDITEDELKEIKTEFGSLGEELKAAGKKVSHDKRAQFLGSLAGWLVKTLHLNKQGA